MDKKIMIGVVAAVVVIAAVAAAAYYFVGGGDSDDEDDKEFTILVEDQEGVYFWTEASGDTLGEALKGTTPNATFVTSSTSWGTSVDSINGLASDTDTSGDATTYLYWSLYLYDAETKSLTYSSVGVDEVKYGDCDAVAFFYVESTGMGDPSAGGPDNLGIPDFSDPEVYDGETEDVTFTIQSSSGMSFQIAGDGTTVYDAFKDAAGDYGVPYVASTDSSTGAENGISSMFGLAMSQDDSGSWVYWGQFVPARGVWTASSYYMSNLSSSDCGSMCIYYGSWGDSPTADAPAPEGYTGTVLVMDQYGVYTWSQVTTENYGDAIKNNEVPGITFTSTQTSYGTSISAINGLANVSGANPDGSYTYWSLMTYDGSSWTYASSGPDGLETSEYRVIGYFYATTLYDSATGTTVYTEGGPDNLASVMPSITDVGEIYGQDTDDVKIAIQSKSGFYICIEGEGSTLDAAFIDACDDYNVPYVTTSSETYGTSLDSIFGMATTSETVDGTEVWTWWNQCHVEDGAWVSNTAGMGNTTVSSGTVYGFVYNSGDMPTAPTEFRSGNPFQTPSPPGPRGPGGPSSS